MHQEHLQIGKSYVGKFKIYLNDTKPIVERELKPLHVSNTNWTLYTESGLSILLFRVQITSRMIYFQL